MGNLCKETRKEEGEQSLARELPKLIWLSAKESTKVLTTDTLFLPRLSQFDM